MKIHKVREKGLNNTICGVNRPDNTTTDPSLVTCKECKKSKLNKNLLGSVKNVETLREVLAGWGASLPTPPRKGLACPN